MQVSPVIVVGTVVDLVRVEDLLDRFGDLDDIREKCISLVVREIRDVIDVLVKR